MQRFRTEILAAWRREARKIPVAHDLSPVLLVDHIPELLDQIAAMADSALADGAGWETARGHALDRLGQGFSVAAVVKELSMLRECIFLIWEREQDGRNTAALRAIDLAIDRAIEASVSRYAEARERSLEGMDRIATATLESRSVEELLHRLLSVFKETTPAVDTAAILLAEGDRLRVRAAVGLDDDVVTDASVRIGEGFSGTIAARRAPMHLRAAFLDPLVKSEAIRRRGVRALYGVPLIHDGAVIGVAHMGSIAAHEFSDDDRQFFESLIARATVGIVHQTLRHELAEAARERERTLAKLESLLAASPVGIAFLDRDLRYQRLNDALAALNGAPASEHLGRTAGEMLPELAEALERVLRRVRDTGRPVLNLEVQRRNPRTDHTLYLLVNYFPVRSPSGEISGLGGVIVDISATRRAQEALELEQARLQSIVEHAPAAIWIKDDEGRIVLANHRLAAAVGHEWESVLGRTSHELLPPEIAAQHDEHDRIVRQEHRAIEIEEFAPSPNGLRTFLSIKFPLPGDPPLIGGIATEITERKRMEEELRVAVRAREDLLAVVSHDLRSPLGTVKLGVEMLLATTDRDHPSHRQLERIDRSCKRMETLIDDLLDTAAIRSGRFQLELSRELVDKLVSEVIDTHAPLAAEKGIALVRSCDIQGVPIRCDRDRVLQVFANLIGNAIKFCGAGDTITVSCSLGHDQVIFVVQDTGPGLPRHVLPRLFEPYWSGPDHGTQGSGLGLYIVRGIVESHGGRVWAESPPGTGARFGFTLPIARP